MIHFGPAGWLYKDWEGIVYPSPKPKGLCSRMRKTPNPSDYPAVKKFLESTPIESFHMQKFSPTNHVGLDASSVMIVELKDGNWIKAQPIK